jgi:hypothetical protein
MLLQNRFAPRPSKKSLFVVALLALVTLPSFFGTARTEAETPSKPDTPAAPARKPDRPPGSEFPYTVRFEEGASKLPDGDKIAITEVRGTASSFTPGNIYWIKGTYTLASQDKAMLLAATTAADSKFGTGSTFKVQQSIVDRGTGTFTLFLPMSCQGWPHVSFYPAEGGGDIGGTYFGTGEFVLRKWWGSNVTEVVDESSLQQLQTVLRSMGVRIEHTGGPNGPVIAIDFAGHYMDDAKDLALLAAFKSLTTVGLGRTGLKNAGLGRLSGITQLATLYIDNTQIDDAGLNHLKSFPGLTTLGLGHTRTTDAGLVKLRNLTNLTTLYIDNTQITDGGLRELKPLKNLTTLGLGHTRTTDAGIKMICDYWNLTTLYIDNTEITDAGLKDLARLTSLSTLGLGHTQTTDAGLRSLAKLKNLSKLYLDHTQVTDSGVSQFHEALPDVDIVR